MVPAGGEAGDSMAVLGLASVLAFFAFGQHLEEQVGAAPLAGQPKIANQLEGPWSPTQGRTPAKDRTHPSV